MGKAGTRRRTVGKSRRRSQPPLSLQQCLGIALVLLFVLLELLVLLGSMQQQQHCCEHEHEG